jgi:hypothetical protein
MKPHLFNRDDATRIKQWAYTDSGLILQQPRYLENKTKYAIGLVKTGGISARSTTTAGSGDVTIYKAESTTLATSGRDVTAYNLDDSTYSAGEYVTLMQEYSTGKWVVIQGAGCECGTNNEFYFDSPYSNSATFPTYNLSYTITTSSGVDEVPDGGNFTISYSMEVTTPFVVLGTWQIRIALFPEVGSTNTGELTLNSTNSDTSLSGTNSIDEYKTVDTTTTGTTTLEVTVDYDAYPPECDLQSGAGFFYSGTSQSFPIVALNLTLRRC